MPLNELNIMFGPRIPDDLDAVGLAFVAAPEMRPDFAVASLSAQRYVQNNFDHLEEDIALLSEVLFIPQETIEGKTLTVGVGKAPITGLTNPNAYGDDAWLSSQISLSEENWRFQIPHEAIEVLGINISKANSWRPIIKPGVVWRPYILQVGATEPGSAISWIRRAIPEPSDGQPQYIILIYAVPEHRYGTEVTTLNLPFPPNPARFKVLKEIGQATAPNKISYDGIIHSITEITINGTSRFSGTYTGVEDDDYIKAIDFSLKTIDVSRELLPDDIIEITYNSYADFYNYSGFRSYNASSLIQTWYPFDANPEYGHVIGNDTDENIVNSSIALLNKVTLYAIPSAIMVPTFVEDTVDPDRIGTLTLTFHRGVDFNETHFVRHMVSPGDITEKIITRSGGAVANTWGFATLGLNYYDEQVILGGDRFSNRFPYMIPLGRFVLGAPAAVESVSNADIRIRGGGVPSEYPDIAVDSTSGGIDTLKGFLDLGIWEGKAIKDGGVVEIKIDPSKLTTDENNTDPTKFLASEIEEIVKGMVPPGIDYEIVYETV